ncbi:MAG: double zinc ribbon domain-containing protein [Candidatus Binatia bacterium]
MNELPLVTCSSCGSENAPRNKFCGECGKPLAPSPLASSRGSGILHNRPNCEVGLPDDAAFCGNCGNPLDAVLTCTRCGRGNPAAMRFRLGCGQPISSRARHRVRRPLYRTE